MRIQTMSPPHPLALTPCLPTELLSYILQQTSPTTLVICGSREAFLSSLIDSTSFPPIYSPISKDTPEPESSQPQSLPDSHLSPEGDDPSISDPLPQLQPQPQPQQRCPLLRATLHQISLSRRTTTVFIPTVSHLRAYLSAFSITETAIATARAAPSLQTRPVSVGEDGLQGTAAAHSLLVVYGLVALHRGTSEWSTQGLCNTCAAVLEAGRRCAKRVVLVEPWHVQMAEQEEGDEEEEEEKEGEGQSRDGGGDARIEVADDGVANADEDSDRKSFDMEWESRKRDHQGIWYEKLPILSGSVRRAGMVGVEYGGRTLEVGMVLRRWFVFKRGEWGDSDLYEDIV